MVVLDRSFFILVTKVSDRLSSNTVTTELEFSPVCLTLITLEKKVVVLWTWSLEQV